jgi:hypothetical protein
MLGRPAAVLVLRVGRCWPKKMRNARTAATFGRFWDQKRREKNIPFGLFSFYYDS